VSDINFLKGHGTQNDFVVLPDPDGTLKLTDTVISALCDRQRGLGADGILRVVTTAALAREEDVPADAVDTTWFMDYRNADGSRAEMCGNGVRVFARYLWEAGLVIEREFVIGTRAGRRAVLIHDDLTVTVHMGKATVLGESATEIVGHHVPGLGVDLGNPHLAVLLDEPIADLDLLADFPIDARMFPHGVNIEFLNPVSATEVAMRVKERGVGETRSCGTGTVAAAKAYLRSQGKETGSVAVQVPGGTVQVTIEEEAATLTGPAEFVASGVVSRSWWDAQ
jgi:diaminopimelate epimerase